jgi:hypothetical protein
MLSAAATGRVDVCARPGQLDHDRTPAGRPRNQSHPSIQSPCHHMVSERVLPNHVKRTGGEVGKLVFPGPLPSMAGRSHSAAPR